jgi:hypothetical protein
MATNFDVIVIDTTASNGISLSITGGNTVSVAADLASLSAPGTVQTRNATDPQATAASVSVVPTQYYVQQEIARLELAIAGATGALRYEPISSYVEP